MKKIKILFLCTGNSCRSQMAEGWANYLLPDSVEAFSAGIEAQGVNPFAIQVMAEAGVDISGHSSKKLNDLDVHPDIVITVCGHAHENCPVFLGKAKVIHQGFEDPPALAAKLSEQGASHEEIVNCYRKVRDEIAVFIKTLPSSILSNKE